MSIGSAPKRLEYKRGMMPVSEAGKKGGQTRGEIIAAGVNPNAKITLEQAIEIVNLEGKQTPEWVAVKYRISPSQVWRIWRGESWKEAQIGR